MAYRTVGVTTLGIDTGSQYTGITTTLALTAPRLLRTLKFYAVEAGSYALVINGTTYATVVAASPAEYTFTPTTPIELPAGSYTVSVAATAGNKKVRYFSGSPRTMETGMTVTGISEFAGAFTPQWAWDINDNPTTSWVAANDYGTAKTQATFGWDRVLLDALYSQPYMPVVSDTYTKAMLTAVGYVPPATPTYGTGGSSGGGSAPPTLGQIWPRGVSLGGGTVPTRSYAVDVPAGSTTAVITHNLNTLDIVYQLRLKATGEIVETDATVTDTNTLTLSFAAAPTVGQYRVAVFA